MPVRPGISPIGWSNDDLPELGGDIPLDTCLAEAREAGFEGIELGHKFPRDPALLRPLLARRGPNKSGEADPLGRSESPIYCKGSLDARFCLVHLVQRSDGVS